MWLMLSVGLAMLTVMYSRELYARYGYEWTNFSGASGSSLSSSTLAASNPVSGMSTVTVMHGYSVYQYDPQVSLLASYLVSPS
jgi:hypothetical protein